jgi:DNA polymerase bacteriophage-type
VTNLFLDFETASEVDLESVGLDNYVHNNSTRVLMLGYAIDNEEVKLWQPHLSSRLPSDLADAISDPQVTKLAWNAPFEINVFRHILKIDLPLQWWRCIQVQARYLSLPGGLDKVGEILGLTESEAKVGWQGGKTKEDTRLINKFCFPAHAGGEQTLFGISTPFFRDWNTDPKDWQLFCEYCKRDVFSERLLFNKMKSLLLPESEQQVWYLDQKINETGLPTNRKFAENMYKLASDEKNRLINLLKEKTGLENPNSGDQMLGWLKNQGYSFGSIKKEFVVSALNEAKETSQLTDLGREVLLIRQEAAKQSYQKLEKLHNFVSPDGRLRHQFLYFGAARTGRWSGTGVQVQNLTRPMKEVEKKYDRAIEIINAGNYEAAKSEFSSVIGMATSCIRSAFQASPGKKLVVCDYSAIENRVLGWLAGCETTLRVFKEGRDPYLDFASELFGIPYDELKRRYDAGDKEAAWMRQMAKPAVLGAGYGLGGGELRENKYKDIVKTGMWGYAENLGVKMTREEAHKSVTIFREKRPKIVELWANLENAAIQVLQCGGEVQVGPVFFDRKKRSNGQFILRTLLPSGRHLHYFNAKVTTRILQGKKGEYEKQAISYEGIGHGVGATSDQQKWGLTYIYGGKFTENQDQAISRDILVNGMINANKAGFDIFGTFHDEIGAEVRENAGIGIKELRQCMIMPSSWGKDIPLDAAGWEGKIYKK